MLVHSGCLEKCIGAITYQSSVRRGGEKEKSYVKLLFSFRVGHHLSLSLSLEIIVQKYLELLHASILSLPPPFLPSAPDIMPLPPPPPLSSFQILYSATVQRGEKAQYYNFGSSD